MMKKRVNTLRLSSIGYIIKQGFKNIWHNLMFSLASVATMIACIFLFGLFSAVLMNFDSIVKSVEQEVGVTVLFEDGISQERIDEIGDEIREFDGVTDVAFTSAEEAWEEFQLEYFEGDEAAAATFGDDNPLANSASYTVQVDEIEKQNDLVAYIQKMDGVSKVNQSAGAVDTLSSFNNLIGYVSLFIIMVLLVVSVFLISNTVTTGINVRKNEIAIMKWIGATDSFVRAPFVVEGAILGLVGAAIPLVVLYLVYDKIIGYVLYRFSILATLSNATVAANDLFRLLIPAGLILGLGFGLAGSIMTVRKHLKV